ncbi:hypothetical protein [Nonomuraea rubra]|uniref:hypothetical protein n=1 Tax=Nonomuraea rubra TaxID=46180 RepID=UPI0033EC7E58
MNDPNGRTALVTGASRGIDQEIATRLAARGALAIVHYGTTRTPAGSPAGPSTPAAACSWGHAPDTRCH